jgi:phi13 family phage major tail protein
MAKGYRINVKNLHYAICTLDDATGVTYCTPKPLEKVMSIKMSPKVIDGKFYGDGTVQKQTSRIDTIEVEIELNKVPLKIRAELLGNTYDKGTSEEKYNDIAPDIALGYEIEKDNGKNEYVWLYKGQMQPIEDDLKQTEAKIEYQSQKTKYTFIPRIYDGKLRKFADSEETDFVADTATNWFKAVPVPVTTP